jgi:hypothetical protein
MGLTPKEKQARYRERMRAQRPDHYENQKKKIERGIWQPGEQGEQE